MIVRGAIDIVALDGFDLSVRDMAGRLGVSHSVLFRHFPTKAALLKRIYDEVFVSRLRPEWTALLADEALPLAERLVAFYRAYTTAIFNDQWVRIFLFAGLKGTTLNRDYFTLLETQVLTPIGLAVRRNAGAATPDGPLSAAEMERAWGLHGRIFYLAIRRHVYRRPIGEPIDEILTDAVAAFLSDLERSPPPRALERGSPAPVAVEVSSFSRRMNPDLRARSIVQGAVASFARHGMSLQMRELARHLGIAHSLLFHYFPTKRDLIEQVYAEAFDRPWETVNRSLLLDRGRPLRERLLAFYRAYLSVVDRDEWIRIFVGAGLHDAGLCGRYLDRVEACVIDVIAAEACDSLGAANPNAIREAVWGLHGQIVYRAIRQRIYAMPAADAPQTAIETAVSCFLAGLARRRLADR